VRMPAMLQSWEHLTFLHWRYDPTRIQTMLPEGLCVDVFDGSAWVGLTPFRASVRPPYFPRLMSLHFPETNLRTYVRDRAGRKGVWFFSLDAGSRAAVYGARVVYRLPYKLSQMLVDRFGFEIRYRSRRIWPDRGPATDVVVETGEAYAPVELGDLDNFLTARWRLYAVFTGSRLAVAKVEHAPWPLTRARVLRLDENLTAAAGLPRPESEPLVHYSPGVHVRVGPLLPL
jgi:uncharacterized protein YqjF (DUF2071 family)